MLVKLFLLILAIIFIAFFSLYGIQVLWLNDQNYICTQQISLGVCFVILSVVLAVFQGYLIWRLRSEFSSGEKGGYTTRKMTIVLFIFTVSFVYRALYCLLFVPLYSSAVLFRSGHKHWYLLFKGLFYLFGEILPIFVILYFHYDNIRKAEL